MTSYTYAVGGFLNVESDIKVFLFDTSPGASVPEPDILLRETDTEGDTVEWTGDRVRIALPPSLAVEKTSSAEPVRFTKLLLSALQGMLLRQGATLAFGSALQTPDGGGVGLFGPSNCGKSTASFCLARQRRYRLLSDDLLICYEGRVYPFPRYVNLPRDVAAVEQWVRSDAVPGERVRSWADEVDVPRGVVSERVSGGARTRRRHSGRAVRVGGRTCRHTGHPRGIDRACRGTTGRAAPVGARRVDIASGRA